MRIRTAKGPAPYLNRRDQYRILALCGLLTLIMVAINVAAKPETWHWLLPPAAEEMTTEPERSVDEIDFSVRRQPRALAQGTFLAAADAPAEPSAPNTAKIPITTELPAEWLAPVEDNTLGMTRAETFAAYQILQRLDQLPAGAFEQADREATFTVMMLEPDEFRGRLVRLTGELRRLTRFPVRENPHGIDELYEAWFFTADSGTNPYRILLTELPPGIPVGESIDPQRVSVTGYFFKRFGYAAAGGQHVAPMLLAKTVNWRPPGSAAEVAEHSSRYLAWSIVGVVVVVVLVVWGLPLLDRSDSQSLARLKQERHTASSSDLDGLRNEDVVDPAELFGRTAYSQQSG